MEQGTFALFVAGGLWLALWKGSLRLYGLVPVAIGFAAVASISPPDLLISGDGRHVGITGLAEGELVVLRESRSDYTKQNLNELAGMNGEVRTVDSLPEASCTPEFCALPIERGGRTWHLLMSRGTDWVPRNDLVEACAASDIVIADRWLPRACQPRYLKADGALLSRTGGLAIDLDGPAITTVAEQQGDHGWWSKSRPPPKPRRTPPSPTASPAAPGGSAAPQ